MFSVSLIPAWLFQYTIQNEKIMHDREPIGNTCPDIDKIMKAMTEIEKVISRSKKADESELRSYIDDIEYFMPDYWVLETLRKSNDELRKWGNEEAINVDRLELELESLTPTTNNPIN